MIRILIVILLPCCLLACSPEENATEHDTSDETAAIAATPLTLDTTSDLSIKRSMARMVEELSPGDQRLVSSAVRTLLIDMPNNFGSPVKFPPRGELKEQMHGLNAQQILDFELSYEIDIARRTVEAMETFIADEKQKQAKYETVRNALDTDVVVQINRRYIDDSGYHPKGMVEVTLKNNTPYPIVEYGVEIQLIDNTKSRHYESIKITGGDRRSIETLIPAGDSIVVQNGKSLRHSSLVKKFENADLRYKLFDLRSSDLPDLNPVFLEDYENRLPAAKQRLEELLATQG